MSQPVEVEGLAALDVIIATYAGKLTETWPGDEALVGLLVQERLGSQERTGVAWSPRARVLADLTRRRDQEQDARRRARFAEAVAAVSGEPVSGKVTLVVSGWGDLLCVVLEADDLRTGRRLTSFSGGSA